MWNAPFQRITTASVPQRIFGTLETGPGEQPGIVSSKFRKEIVDVIRHRLPNKHKTAWDLWVQKHPQDVITPSWNLPETVVCNTAGIGPDEVGTLHAYMVSWAAVLTSQPHQRPAPTQFTGIPLIMVTPANRLAHALCASTTIVHTESAWERIMDLQMLQWASAPTIAGYFVDASAQQCTPTLRIRAHNEMTRSSAEMVQALSGSDTSPLEDVLPCLSPESLIWLVTLSAGSLKCHLRRGLRHLRLPTFLYSMPQTNFAAYRRKPLPRRTD